jgi:predicted nucleotidyltransferase
MNPQLQTILSELKTRLSELYGERLEKLVLFGSQARGDAEPDSDIDVLVVLKGEVNPYAETSATSPIRANINLRHRKLVSCFYVSSDRYHQRRGSLMTNAHREGLTL